MIATCISGSELHQITYSAVEIEAEITFTSNLILDFVGKFTLLSIIKLTSPTSKLVFLLFSNSMFFVILKYN